MKLILASGSFGRRKLLSTLKIPFEVMEIEVDEEKIVDCDPVKMAVARAKAKAEGALAQIVNYVETRHGASSAKKQDMVGIANVGVGRISDRETHESCVSTRKNINDTIILAADTVGFLDKWIFGKPRSRREAEEMLKRLSGKTHKYVSAHTIIKFEIRNSKLETNSNDKIINIQNKKQKPVLNLENLNLRNCFGFRHSDFEFISGYDISSVTLRKLTPADIAFYLDRVPYTKLCGAIQIMDSPQNFVTTIEGSLSTVIGLCLEKVAPLLFKQIYTNL